ncbi:hypothetical protein [Shimia sp. MIT910701]|uniref:hypothetical protein n=1 Tax=Shimia sp. MIT910701 TaxID=3096987 RepID=UPI00399A83D7
MSDFQRTEQALAYSKRFSYGLHSKKNQATTECKKAIAAQPKKTRRHMKNSELCDPIRYFLQRLKGGAKLCLLPISRLHTEQIIPVSSDVVIYPAGSLSADDFNLVWWPSFGYDEICRRNKVSANLVSVEGNDLHWIKSAATLIDRDTLFDSTIIAVLVDLDWGEFLEPPAHEFHLECLRKAIAIAETHMDLIKFRYCNPKVPETFPGTSGYHSGSGFTSGVFYTLRDNESYLISGEIVSTTLVRGLGLELDSSSSADQLGDGQVGKIAKHALRLYSEALIAPTETMKFVQLMNLIEYIASPFEYMKMANVKKKIAYHVAKDRDGYQEIIEDFKLLTSEPGSANGPNNGLRHNIVHLGKNIEQLTGPAQRSEIFGRMISYTSIPIHDLIKFSGENWDAIDGYRMEMKQSLGV